MLGVEVSQRLKAFMTFGFCEGVVGVLMNVFERWERGGKSGRTRSLYGAAGPASRAEIINTTQPILNWARLKSQIGIPASDLSLNPTHTARLKPPFSARQLTDRLDSPLAARQSH